MSTQETRIAIANAANTVEGVRVTPYLKTMTKPGQGCVRFDGRTKATNGFGYMNRWQVFVVLNQDIETSERWLDDFLSELIEAIEEELIVTSASPQMLAVDKGLVPVITIEGTRAA